MYRINRIQNTLFILLPFLNLHTISCQHFHRVAPLETYHLILLFRIKMIPPCANVGDHVKDQHDENLIKWKTEFDKPGIPKYTCSLSPLSTNELVLRLFLTITKKNKVSTVSVLCVMLRIFIQDSLFSSQGELLSMWVLRRRS